MIYLTGEEVSIIHYTIMEMYEDSEQAGIKFLDKFEAMIERPKTILYGEEQFPTMVEKACCYCYYHSIARGGHIFHNGNKRTALTVFVTVLDINGFDFMMESKQAEDFTVYLANEDKFRENDCIRYLLEELSEYIIVR